MSANNIICLQEESVRSVVYRGRFDSDEGFIYIVHIGVVVRVETYQWGLVGE